MRGRISTIALLVAAVSFLLGSPAVAQYGGGGGAPSGGGAGEAPGGEDEPAKDKTKKPKKKPKWGRQQAPDGEEEWVSQYEPGIRFSKRLGEARIHLIEENFDECEKVLSRFKLNRLNPLERARVYQTFAFVEYGRENIDGARDYLELSIAEDALSREDQAEMRYQVAQMFLQEQNWPKAAENLEVWFTVVKKPNAASFNTLALTYYQMEEFEKALAPATTAVAMTDKPNERWLQLLLAIRLTRKDYVEAVPVLEQLVKLYPTKTYWLQLSTVYGALERYKESLVLLQLAYAQELLDKDEEFRRMAEMMLFMELPYRAGEVLEKALAEKLLDPDSEAYELLSNSRIAARNFEAAVEPLEKAAELSEVGELYIRLAQVHLQREDWSAAADSLRMALEKGGLESEGDAQLLMGITFYSQKQPGQALTWFGRASRHEETAQEAQVWLRYIERELQSG